jgi:magnesium chelatase accessory protein
MKAAAPAAPTVFGPPPAALPPDWPLREHSGSVDAGGLRWHVQWLRERAPARAEPRPVALLLHGTGASTHSLARLALELSGSHEVIVPDLPGHAFSQRPARADGLSLPGMAAAVGALLQALQRRPALIVGHSAGAAVAARLVLDGLAEPGLVVSLSGAWFPPGGVAGWWYAPAARLLALNPLVPHLFAWQAARPAALKKLLDSTGSQVDATSAACYARLVGDPAHVGAVLAMMAAWELPPLLHELPRLRCPLALVAAERDTTVPPEQAQALHRRLPGVSRVHLLSGLGHLAHEEDAPRVAALIRQLAAAEPVSTPD